MTKKTKIIGLTGLGLSFALATAGFTTSMVMIARDNQKKKEEDEAHQKQDYLARQQASTQMTNYMIICESKAPEIYDWCDTTFKKPFDKCYNDSKISGLHCYAISQIGVRCIERASQLVSKLTDSMKNQLKSIYDLNLSKMTLDGLYYIKANQMVGSSTNLIAYIEKSNAYYDSMLKEFLTKNLNLIVQNDYKLSYALSEVCNSVTYIVRANEDTETRLKAAIDAVNSFGYSNIIKVNDPYKGEMIADVITSMSDALLQVETEYIPQVVKLAKESVENIVKK